MAGKASASAATKSCLTCMFPPLEREALNGTYWDLRRDFGTTRADARIRLWTKGPERKREQLPERQVGRGAHLRETQRHPHLAVQGLTPVGREQPIPPRKEVREVAV